MVSDADYALFEGAYRDLMRLTARAMSFKIGRTQLKDVPKLRSRREYKKAEQIIMLSAHIPGALADYVEWKLIDAAKRWPEKWGRYCTNQQRGGGRRGSAPFHAVYLVVFETC